MCKVQMLRALVKQRLNAAVEEIFVLFERTIAEYEEELSRAKVEHERHRKLLDAVFQPQIRLHRAVTGGGSLLLTGPWEVGELKVLQRPLVEDRGSALPQD
ncbi:hypothetical protein NQZ68_031140 [Dissostichus eleginoides]|nr:hypothetical protein NQZ68_031140 [Dissostichus eleginoides]